MKKIMSLLLAMVILVGCSGAKNPNEKYYGIWALGGINYNGSYFSIEELEDMGGYYVSSYYKDEYFILKDGGAAVLYDRSWNNSYLREWKFENGKLFINDKEFVVTDSDKIEYAYSDNYNLVFKKISESQDISELKNLIKSPETEIDIQPDDNMNSQASDDIRPDFKQTMDDYEAFFDSYVDFMEKFQSSDNVMSLMNEYLEFLDKYQEAMDGMEALEDSDLNDKELKYYTEVTLRIEQKLLSAI